MKYHSCNRILSIGLFTLGINFLATHSYAGTSGGIYDMSKFLNEQHPFAQNQTIISPDTKFLNERTSTIDKEILTPVRGAVPLKHYVLDKKNSDQKILKNKSRTFVPGGGGKTHTKTRLDHSQVKKIKSDNVFSEIRIGALWHDQGPFSHRKERGYDGNLEILFTAPEFLNKIWGPRPHMGISINSAGDTNQTYAGLTWERDFYEYYFANFSLGAGYHDGYKVTDLQDRKSLGCKLLFRESIDVGFRFQINHSIMAHLDHISNAKLCSTNEGLESVGIRYGYHF